MSRPETTNEARRELGGRLEVAVSEARMARGWERIEGRVFGAPKRVRHSRELAVGGLLVVAVILCAVVLSGLFGSPGELRTVDGDPAARLEASGALGDTLRFEDGSWIDVAAGSQLEPLENSGERFVVLLRQGQARFVVEPGGPRRWVIEAGATTVEVVGTVFTVRRDENGVTVAVERGRVLVRSERLTDHVVALGQGETVHVDALWEPLAVGDLPPPNDVAGDDSDARPRVAESRLPVAPAPPAESMPERAAAGPAVIPQTESVGRTPSDSPSPDPAAPEDETPAPEHVAGQNLPASRLLILADDARRAGDVSRALELLDAASNRAGDVDSAVASLTRARLMSSRGRPAEAAIDLRRAIRLGLPSVLEESARYQLVAALARSSDPVGAREAAAAYLHTYPDGVFRAEVQRNTP